MDKNLQINSLTNLENQKVNIMIQSKEETRSFKTRSRGSLKQLIKAKRSKIAKEHRI